jgi:hypothetical protein
LAGTNCKQTSDTYKSRLGRGEEAIDLKMTIWLLKIARPIAHGGPPDQSCANLRAAGVATRRLQIFAPGRMMAGARSDACIDRTSGAEKRL